MAKVNKKSEKITAFGGIFFVLDKFDTSAKVVHEPEHRVPSHYRNGGKLLPIHRGTAAHGTPLWNQGHRQSQEFPVQIHRRTCQMDQNRKTIQTQHLLQQTI